MTKVCYLCKKVLEPSSLKTSRSRFKIMGLQPPIGMGESDRICGNCLKKIHDKELRRIKVTKLQ